MSPRLTINLGLRWDIDLPRTERYNRLSYFGIPMPLALAQGSGIPEPQGRDEVRHAGPSPPDADGHEQLGATVRLRLPVRA